MGSSSANRQTTPPEQDQGQVFFARVRAPVRTKSPAPFDMPEATIEQINGHIDPVRDRIHELCYRLGVFKFLGWIGCDVEDRRWPRPAFSASVTKKAQEPPRQDAIDASRNFPRKPR